MRARSSWIAAGLSLAAVLWSSPARPCGGAFGANVTIGKEQTIVVAFDAGTETYVFQPHFCGQAMSFGLILPIPAALTANPTLASSSLFTELAAVSAPTHQKKTLCRGSRSSFDDGTGTGGASDAGVSVIDRGQVGIFDWSLLKADSTSSFTAWLDANSYPHALDADEQFAHYVELGWYFVAFKVTATTVPTSQTVCGDFGPIQLAFPSAQPVVPSRIAAVSDGNNQQNWIIYTIAADQMTSDDPAHYPTRLAFSGLLDASVLGQYPGLAALAPAGSRLTKLAFGFYSTGLTADLVLKATPATDFRDTVADYVYEDCGVSCAVGGAPSWVHTALPCALLVLSISTTLLFRARRRVR